MKLRDLTSVEIKGIGIPTRVPVPPFADKNKLSDRIFGAFCRVNPELPCMQDKKFIKRVFECIKSAGGKDFTSKPDLVSFVASDKEIAKWRKWYAEEKERKAAWKKANADEIKKQNDELKAKYGIVKINGNDEPLASWTIEPEGIFFGRGDSPLNGYWKFENTAADIKLNTNSKNLPEALFYGEDGEMLITSNFAWNVAWNPESHFAAQYNINIGIPNTDGSIKTLKSTKYKMIQFAAASSVKKEGQTKKYAAGATLGKSYEKVLAKIASDFKAKKDLSTTVAVFMLFEKGIRIGFAGETENGTKGLLALEWGKDVKRSGNKIKFDFYGKDSVRDTSVIETEYADIIEETWAKDKMLKTDKLQIKQYISQVVPELDGIFTPKLARTAVAAYTATKALEEMTAKYKVTKSSPLALKKIAFDEATMQVARRLNHQRGVNKVAEEKRKANFKASEEKLDERKAKVAEQNKKREEKIKALKASKKEGYKDKIKALKEQIENSKAKIDQAELNLESKERNQNFTSGTCKSAYIDPSIVSDWCRKIDMPIEKVYTASQIKQFSQFLGD